MTTLTLHHGDCRQVLRDLKARGVQVHSVVCDPPYHLESVVKRFGKQGAAPAKAGSDGRFARQSRGFMGQVWDGADADGSRIAQDPEFWQLVYDVLLPGGYVLAFSSPRTGHWQACAMEMAGFVMHPFLGWVYGQGFPKAHAVGKTAGSEWEGWFYGTQSTKPALEPIYMAQKPFSEKTGFANVLKHGVGAVNIDACRVEPTGEGLGGGAEKRVAVEGKHEGWVRPWMQDAGSVEAHASRVRSNVAKAQDLGRWPANLVHDGSDDVVAMFPSAPGQLARSSSSSETRKNQNTYGEMRRGAPENAMDPRGDSGSAARFFNAFPVDPDPIRYQGKATKADRGDSKHPTVKPIALMRWLCRLVTPPGGIVLDPFARCGTSGQAAREEGFGAILIERETSYVADIRRRLGLAPPMITDPEVLELLGLAPLSEDLIG